MKRRIILYIFLVLSFFSIHSETKAVWYNSGPSVTVTLNSNGTNVTHASYRWLAGHVNTVDMIGNEVCNPPATLWPSYSNQATTVANAFNHDEDGFYVVATCVIANGVANRQAHGPYNIDRNAPYRPNIYITNNGNFIGQNSTIRSGGTGISVQITEEGHGESHNSNAVAENGKVGPSPWTTDYRVIRNGITEYSDSISGGPSKGIRGNRFTIPYAFGDGNYTIRASSRDSGGNSGNQTFSFTIDSTPPVISANPNSVRWNVNPPLSNTHPRFHRTTFQTSPTGTRISATDNLTGINIARYRWNNSNCWSGTNFTASGQNIVVPGEGTHRLYVCVEDGAGNRSTRDFGSSFDYDNTVPNEPIITSPTHPNGVWTSNDVVTANFSTRNGVHGPSPHYYLFCVDETDTCTPFAPTQSLNQTDYHFPNDGQWYFRASTIDAGGESSAISSRRLFVDTGAGGDINSFGNVVGVNSVDVTSHPGAVNDWTHLDIGVNINVSDANSGGHASSGITDAYYLWVASNTNVSTAGNDCTLILSGVGFSGNERGTNFGGGGAISVTGTARTDGFRDDGSYKLNICSVDGAGNQYYNNYEFYNLDRHTPRAPTISASNPNGVINHNDWVTNNSITVNIAEAGNGNRFYNATQNGEVGPSPWTTQYCAVRGTGASCTPNLDILGSVNAAGPGDPRGGNYDIPAPGGTWLDGERTIRAVSTDTGSNREAPIIETFTMRIDTQDPDTDANPPSRLNWLNVATLNIVLTANDIDNNGYQSGLVSSSYIVNQSATHSFGPSCGGIPMAGGNAVYTDFAEGTNYIHMCSLDAAGNQHTETFGYYLVDLTDPTVTDDYGVKDGVWQNTDQVITLTAIDNESGVNTIRYCYGAGCTPTNTLIPPFSGVCSASGSNLANAINNFNAQCSSYTRIDCDPIGGAWTCSSAQIGSASPAGTGPGVVTHGAAIPTFLANAPTDVIVRYDAIDYAGRTSIIHEIDVKTENYIPTAGALTYHDGWDNNTIASQRDISYSAADTGGSGLETVILQRRVAITNNAGGFGAWGAWQDAEANTGLNTDIFSRTYSQPFVNGRAMQFRVLTTDEAGNNGIIVDSTNILRMDDVIPTVTDDYDDTTEDGVWLNTAQTINFTILDNDSGVANVMRSVPENGSGRRYCSVAIGGTCTPNIYLPNSLSFVPETENTIFYEATDRAGNNSILESVDVLIEDNRPTGSISYFDGRDNNGKHGITAAQSLAQRTISYNAADTGGSQLENVTLQRQTTNTNNAGGIGPWPTAWTNVPGHENTGLDQNNLARTYVQPFENGRAVRFRLVVNDEATNGINILGYIDSTRVIRMDDVDPTVSDNYTNDDVWVNTTQTINFTILDNDSGIPNDITGRRYCTGALGSNCSPGNPSGFTPPGGVLPNTLSFSPDTELQLRYNTTDRAGNFSVPQFGSINILIEDNRPTGTINYLNGWDNNGGDGSTVAQSISNRTISYSARDTFGGGINSNLRTVILQRGACPPPSPTTGTGPCNPATWTDVVTHDIDQATLLNQTYVEPFVNERSYRYRLYIEDHAGNVVAPIGYINSTNVLRMDDEDPSLDLAYTATSGVWYNTTQNITFSESDNYAGIFEEYYCTAPYGSTCDPLVVGTIPPASRIFTAPTELSVFYQAVDNAGNSSNIDQIDVLIEDTNPGPRVFYSDEWVNTPVSLSYQGLDPSTVTHSNIRTIALERREADITANNGSIGSFGAWANIPGEVHNLSSGTPERSPVTSFPAENYVQGFTNRKAYQYRTYIEDVAGNRTWGYINSAGTPVFVFDTDTPPPGSIATLKMENEVSTVIFSNLDSNISANGWTNVTGQSIRMNLADTGGSLLSSYTLQIFDATDNFNYNSLNSVQTAGTSAGNWNGTSPNGSWVNVPGHVNRVIGGITATPIYSFTGLNDHAYTFRVQVTDNAGNTTPWIYSIDDVTPIKIDTVDPIAADVVDSGGSTGPLLATNNHNFIYDVGRNGGAPIINVEGNFENWNTLNGRLGNHSSIDPIDNNSTDPSQINVDHSIQNVDNNRIDPAGHRVYSYRIVEIEDEAGNITTSVAGIRNFNYQVYANTNVVQITTEELNGITNVTNSSNLADGSIDTLTARLADSYGNAIVRADSIGREIDFRLELSADSSILLDQYTRAPGEAIFIETSASSGYQDLDAFQTNTNYLEDLDFETGRDGEYDFNFRIYAPTANSYPGLDSVSDPEARFFIQNFQYAVEHPAIHSAWDTGDQSLDNGQDIEFVYGPLFRTVIDGAIDSFGFIEGADQNSSIQVQKAASTAVTNSRSLRLEFGIGDRLPSPELGLEINSTPIPEGNPNSIQHTAFPNGSQSYPITSLLSMAPGTTLDTIQSSYLSTHIAYNIDTHSVMYNSDIIGKESYYSNTPINNTVQGGIKVLGQTHSGKQKDIVTDQATDDLALLGKLYKASLKKDIVKNAFTIIRNADPTTNITANPNVDDLIDFSNNPEGTSLFNDSIMYFGVDTNDPNSIVGIGSSGSEEEISGEKTILAYGRNIYIKSDLYYDDKDNDILGIIALSDKDGNGGNIYIDPNVTNVVGTLFAEKSVISFDGTDELGGSNSSQTVLRHQLHIYGSVFSENTIGGSREIIPSCPYYLTVTCSRDEAQKYDMNYLRRYFTYREGAYRLPANNAKVIGGGVCNSIGDCTENIDFNRTITDTNTDQYATYPVVVEYNPSAQSNPAPLFESTDQ